MYGVKFYYSETPSEILSLRIMRVGIFFGGSSREREVSFAGGRTVYDNLDQSIFEAVPIFVDSFNNLVLLDWQYIYKGSIRDFYPDVETLKDVNSAFQLYAESVADTESARQEILKNIGRPLTYNDLPSLIDFAFLCLHGAGGEDGSIQGMLELLKIPYSGAGIYASALGMNKAKQKQLMQKMGYPIPEYVSISRNTWEKTQNFEKLFHSIRDRIGLPFVVKAANQGSSIGIGLVEDIDIEAFEQILAQAFFTRNIRKVDWQAKNQEEKHQYLSELLDLKLGLGFPLQAHNTWCYTPDALLELLNNWSFDVEHIVLQARDPEMEVVCEAFVSGREFSCIVVEDLNGRPLALPPTEIVKGSELFDYRAKYLPGLARKVTPIRAKEAEIEAIATACTNLFTDFGFKVYARIDGFLSVDGTIFLNDPNTTSGMLPSSFFFHQAAEIGLNPSQFLSYIIQTSLSARLTTGMYSKKIVDLKESLTSKLSDGVSAGASKIKVGVILGGYSSERHISVESGRNIYEKLSSSGKYEPLSIFLSGDEKQFELYQLPIHLHLKDNADDIKEKVKYYDVHPAVEKIREKAKKITALFAPQAIIKPKEIALKDLPNLVDQVFIALHGRPGEDGTLQIQLDALNIPYNGSGPESSALTINKFETNELLHQHGVKTARHAWVLKKEFLADPEKMVAKLIAEFHLPLIAKPLDDGCSSAVKKIKTADELLAFGKAILRETEEMDEVLERILHLKPKEEFPSKQGFLIEEFINKGDAAHFLEVTGGLLTHHMPDGSMRYEIFEPSESLAGEEVLSLEEKFLAGQGQNITPARYSSNREKQAEISSIVRKELEKTARILNVSGYCRIDAFVKIYADGEVDVYIIEVNSLPGMTPATCIFHQTALNNYKPYQFIDKILEFGKDNKKASIA